MDNITENELLEELARQATPPLIQPGDVTVKMLADRTGKSLNTTGRFLDEQVTAGKLTKHYVIGESGRWCWVYRRA